MESSSNANSFSSSSSGSVNNNSINRNNSDSGSGTVSWFGVSYPISLLIGYSGFMRSSTTTRADSEPVTRFNVPVTRPRFQVQSNSSSSSGGSACSGSTGEVAIRIIGTGEQGNSVRLGSIMASSSSSSSRNQVGEEGSGDCGDLMSDNIEITPLENISPEIRRVMDLDAPLPEVNDVFGGLAGTSTFPRVEIQRITKLLEQILPFSLLLLVVFIRQHLQGFFVTIFVSAVMFKSNEIVKMQTALKGDRKVSVLVGISSAFMLYVICIYWWCRNDDLLYPLVMFPPKATPPFWHAIFIILVNDTLVRQATMAFKCLLLIYYKNGRGHNFRQGQILTLVEYTLLLYRDLLPTPVWYRFFLNKEYGSIFSVVATAVYVTFKLKSAVGNVRRFISALKALSKREVNYGVYATMEQVNAAGDLCTICQEKMHAPVLLCCKHMFCEECVSEWFERERTCPLCRAYVEPADLQTFGDGSTSLFFQLF